MLPNAAQVVERLRDDGAPRPRAEQLVVLAEGAEVAWAGRCRARPESEPPVPLAALPLARRPVLAQRLRALGRVEPVAVGELGGASVQEPTWRGADVEAFAEGRICSRIREHYRGGGTGYRRRSAPVSPAPEQPGPTEQQSEDGDRKHEEPCGADRHRESEGGAGDQRPAPPWPRIVERPNRRVEPDRGGEDRPALGHDRVLQKDLIRLQQHDPCREQASPVRAGDASRRSPQQERRGDAAQMLQEDRERDLVKRNRPEGAEDQRVSRRVHGILEGVRACESLVAVADLRGRRPPTEQGDRAQGHAADQKGKQRVAWRARWPGPVDGLCPLPTHGRRAHAPIVAAPPNDEALRRGNGPRRLGGRRGSPALGVELRSRAGSPRCGGGSPAPGSRPYSLSSARVFVTMASTKPYSGAPLGSGGASGGRPFSVCCARTTV